MTNDDNLELIAAILVIAIIAAVNLWWLPQKWQGCQKIYNGRPAQIICLLSE